MNTRILVFCVLLIATLGRAAATNEPPKFEEVYQLLRTNLAGVSQAELNRAAVKGLLDQLSGQAFWVKNTSNAAPVAAASAPLGKTAVYDDSYVYFRIRQVEAGLAEKLRAAYQAFAQTNKSKIKGVILDLRFAAGDDYAAAGAVADCFLNSEQPLLEWGTGSAAATKKTNVLAGPLAILVNARTRGAAEALAAALREGNAGMILGGTTAGQASLFKEFRLDNGGTLRIATTAVKLGDGTPLAHGLKPDIAIRENLADEKIYLEDPYKILHSAAPLKTAPATNSTASATNQPARRVFNEAELVRQHRAGESEEEGDTVESTLPAAPAPPVIADTALSRALDLLKGIAILQQSRPG